MTIHFTVPGMPFGKQRPRHTKYGHDYTPKETVAYEKLAEQCFLTAVGCGFVPLQGALRIKIFAGYPIPKSTSKKQRALMLENKVLPTKKPDWDNVGKIICDALNGVAYKDDAQITKSEVDKRYIDGPGLVEVWISNL